MKTLVFLLGIALVHTLSLSAPFQNLGFDDANTDNVPIDLVLGFRFGADSVSNLLPGWRLYIGNDEQSHLLVNTIPLFSPFVTLMSGEYPYHPSLASLAEGLYGLYGAGASYSIIQRGEVPQDTAILRYKFVGLDSVAVVDGKVLPPWTGTLPVSEPGFLAFDISGYAGQEVELRLTQNGGFLDSVSFIVPEPRFVLLCGLGALALAGHWLRRAR